MVTDRKGDQTNPETLHKDTKNQPTPNRRPEAIPKRKKKAQRTTTLAVTRIKRLPKATPRRKRLDTHTIKINYIKRLEDLWRQIDTLLSDPETLNQLNTPTYTLTKTGRLQFNHPENTHDDTFWAIALAAHQTTQHQTNKPIFR